MSASCVAELLVRMMDDQRCHVTLPRQNNGMFGFFGYVTVVQPATNSYQTSIDKRVEAIKGAGLRYFVFSFLGGCLFMTRFIQACLIKVLQFVIKALGL